MLDGEPAPLGPPVLLRWKVGKGNVLACGLLPELHHDREIVRDNARQFVARCADWATRHGSDQLVLVEIADRTPAEVAVADAGPPMVPLLAHWGWQVALYDGDEPDALRPLEEVVRDALVPGWMHGADILELSLTDAQHGAPITWPDSDSIERPITYRSTTPSGAWANGGFRELGDEAHARGMLLFGGLLFRRDASPPVVRLLRGGLRRGEADAIAVSSNRLLEGITLAQTIVASQFPLLTYRKGMIFEMGGARKHFAGFE